MTLCADGRDVVHLVAQLRDTDGVPVKAEEREIVFDIQGDRRLLGVDKGRVDSVQEYEANRCKTAHGRCLLSSSLATSPGR